MKLKIAGKTVVKFKPQISQYGRFMLYRRTK